MGACLTCLARLLLGRQRPERAVPGGETERGNSVAVMNPAVDVEAGLHAGNSVELQVVEKGPGEEGWVPEAAAGTDPALLAGESKLVRIVHQTKVAADESVSRFRVFHALARDEVWATRRGEASLEVAIRPDGNRDGDDFVYWETAGPEPGTYTFETSFVCEAAERKVVNADAIPWERSAEGAAEGADPPAEVSEEIRREIAALAQGLSAGTTGPAEFVRRLARWLARETTYDAGVAFGVADVGAFWRERRGWCGHRQRLFAEVCRLAGLPARHAWGFCVGGAKGAGDGAGDGTATGDAGKRDGNRHTWAEVLLPGLGWVEVEPVGADNPFAIPAAYIPCSRELQCVGVWHLAVGAAGAEAEPGDWVVNGVSYEDVIAFGPP